MQNKYGYEIALSKVLKVREHRKKIYGDSWKQDKDYMLLAMMQQKIGRLERFIVERNMNKTYENEVDTLVDLINYGLFLLQNTIDKHAKRK